MQKINVFEDVNANLTLACRVLGNMTKAFDLQSI